MTDADALFSQMELHFFQGQFAQGLACAAPYLDGLAADDDDDAEKIYQTLYLGLKSGHAAEFVEFLASRGFDGSLTWPGKGGLAQLFVNAQCSSPALFAALEGLGMDAALADRAGNTVLHLLASQENSTWFTEREGDMAELARGRENLSAWMGPNAYGATPLHLAVLQRHRELLQALLERGVDPDLAGGAPREGYGHVQDFYGVSALMLACAIGDTQAAGALLAAGAQEGLRDRRGRVACHYALEVPNRHYCPAYYADIPSQRRVQEQKAQLLGQLKTIDTPDDRGATPLLCALTQHSFDAGGFGPVLLGRGADAGRADNSGYTPLMAAAEHRHPQTLKALIAAGADLNAQNNRGETALLLAVRGNDEKAARLLIKKGARADIPDSMGRTAAELAARLGMDSVIGLLLEKG